MPNESNGCTDFVFSRRWSCPNGRTRKAKRFLETWLIIVVECTLQIEQHFDRIDITLDRYICVGQNVSKGNHTETVQEFGANA